MFETMTGAEFAAYMSQENCWSNGPEPMSVEDAAYCLREYKADGIPVPVMLTAKLFAGIWNLLYARDTIAEGGAA